MGHVKLGVKIVPDSKVIGYIPIIRKYTSNGIQKIKGQIENDEPVYSCDYFNLDEMEAMKRLTDELMGKGASVKLYEDDEDLPLEVFQNILTAHRQIAEDTQRMIDLEVGGE